MPRPKPDEETQQVALRVPLSIVRRADALVAQLAQENPGWLPTRTDAMRIILARHLPPDPEANAHAPKKPKPRR